MSRKDKSASPSAPKKPPVEFLPPLKPRRGLFFILAGVLVAWIVVLLTLYFTTVYPMRHPREKRAHGSLGSSVSLGIQIIS
jgi:hypothetical protein